MENNLKILIIENIPGDMTEQTAALKHARMICEVLSTGDPGDLESTLQKFSPDAVVCGFPTTEHGPWPLIEALRENKPDVALIVVAQGMGEGQLQEALRRGATDCVLKANSARLHDAVRHAVQETVKRSRAARLERVHAVRLAVASAIVRSPDRHKLFEAACRSAVEAGGFRMAWVGCVAPEALTLEPVACSGHDEGYLQRAAAVRIRESESKGKGEGLKRLGSVVVNDIRDETSFLLKEDALARGYRSMIGLPLIAGHRVVAILKIYASEPGFFENEERKVLTDVAGDLSYALDQQARQERLSALAYRDALTGLANRRLLIEQLRQELARAHRQETTVAVVFIDIDNFKAVNDTLGHSVGDRLLKEVASRIVSCTREGDIVARLGGDEFVMVLPLESGRDATAIVERMLDSVARPFRAANRKVNVSCSVGVAVYPHDGSDYATLLRIADAAMYRAKASGGGVHSYTDATKRKAAAGMR
ncbi:MAG: diguanylate cyclase domain-containing protein [Betaproteobacteria bacterium]